MNSWGFLGEPTQEQIEIWKNLPYGEFKSMIAELKKKSKGKTLKNYSVEVKKMTENYHIATVKVQAFDHEHAISKAKEINMTEFNWSELKISPMKISYRVSLVG